MATVQCVPNFSTGRSPQILLHIVDAIRTVSDVSVIDWSSDRDHNRSVVTFIGDAKAVQDAVLAAAGVAIALIDIREHSGVHPRLGVVDVIPIIPLEDITMDACIDVSLNISRALAQTYSLPVFAYEFASKERRTLPFIRKNAFTSIAPDFGPALPHPTAGASTVGAREPLIAFNVVLASPTGTEAHCIARELRSGGSSKLHGVRALGLTLESSRQSQVSVNIVDTVATTPWDVFEYVRARAAELGTYAVRSELIGVMPGYAAFKILADSIQCLELRPSQVLMANWPVNPQ